MHSGTIIKRNSESEQNSNKHGTTMVDPDNEAQQETTLNNLQSMMAELKGKTLAAAERLRLLHEENTILNNRVEELERGLRDLEALNVQKTQQLEELQKHADFASAVEVGERLLYLSPDEREALERQIDDLLKRINTHLGSDTR
jgi:predicted nuclease with TOPRIM domain